MYSTLARYLLAMFRICHYLTLLAYCVGNRVGGKPASIGGRSRVRSIKAVSTAWLLPHTASSSHLCSRVNVILQPSRSALQSTRRRNRRRRSLHWDGLGVRLSAAVSPLTPTTSVSSMHWLFSLCSFVSIPFRWLLPVRFVGHSSVSAASAWQRV